MSSLLREMLQQSRLIENEKNLTSRSSDDSMIRGNRTASSVFKRECDDVSLNQRITYAPTVSIRAFYNELDYRTTSRRENLDASNMKRLRKLRPSTEDGDGSLDKMFKFYSKLQKPGVQKMKRALVFDEIRQANASLSYFELFVMFKNFDIIPNLVSKQEYLSIWQSCKARRGRRSEDGQQGNISELDYYDFLEVLVCTALVGFSKPGMCKDLSEISAPLCVERLVEMLNLNDGGLHAARVINSKGKRELAKLNFQSKGERYTGRGKELIDERDAARAASLVLNAPSNLELLDINEGTTASCR